MTHAHKKLDKIAFFRAITRILTNKICKFAAKFLILTEMIDRTPSHSGIGSGLHIGPRPQKESGTQNTTHVTTQQPSNPSPAKRGYA